MRCILYLTWLAETPPPARIFGVRIFGVRVKIFVQLTALGYLMGLQTGILSSALEHAVPEQLFVNEQNPGEAISAVKALQKASAVRQPDRAGNGQGCQRQDGIQQQSADTAIARRCPARSNICLCAEQCRAWRLYPGTGCGRCGGNGIEPQNRRLHRQFHHGRMADES